MQRARSSCRSGLTGPHIQHAMKFLDESVPRGVNLQAHDSAYASAAGKALLSGMPAAREEDLLARIPLPKGNRRTPRTREALERDLDISARRGWYMTRGEFLPDVTAVSTHITLNGELHAGVIAGPSVRVGRQLARLVSLVVGFIAREGAR